MTRRPTALTPARSTKAAWRQRCPRLTAGGRAARRRTAADASTGGSGFSVCRQVAGCGARAAQQPAIGAGGPQRQAQRRGGRAGARPSLRSTKVGRRACGVSRRSCSAGSRGGSQASTTPTTALQGLPSAHRLLASAASRCGCRRRKHLLGIQAELRQRPCRQSAAGGSNSITSRPAQRRRQAGRAGASADARTREQQLGQHAAASRRREFGVERGKAARQRVRRLAERPPVRATASGAAPRRRAGGGRGAVAAGETVGHRGSSASEDRRLYSLRRKPDLQASGTQLVALVTSCVMLGCAMPAAADLCTPRRVSRGCAPT